MVKNFLVQNIQHKNSLYKEMKLFRKRKIDANYPIIYIDVTIINTGRIYGVSKEAFYAFLGVKKNMKREVLGIYNQPTESVSNWKEVFKDRKNIHLDNVT